LEHLGQYVDRKRGIAAAYTRELDGLPGITPMRESSSTYSTFWMYTIRIDGKKGRPDSRVFLSQLKAKNIQTRPLWQPMHLSPAHRGAFFSDCSIAERLNRECLSLPCSVGLEEVERKRVVFELLEASRITP
jgi:perosamine synthetase